MRLDTQEGVFADRGGYAAVVAGDIANSELIARILSSEGDVRMPPPKANLDLTELEKEFLRRWVEQGAPWEEYWAFVPPRKPTVPNLQESWSHNEIDQFVLKRLQEENLAVSPEAEKKTLIRRVYFDLTGLPPTQAEIRAFVEDDSPNAYQELVDRLLASDQCAERLTLDWLDLARYADSHGLHADGLRKMWPWRDWVIEKFRENMPYDEFVTWQLAGDLLPDATDEQRLATAFLRNHPMTAEGGVIDEEFRLSYVFDRLETTATAFLGITIGCARCHDHKFDPFSQREYYQMAAFFNQVRELGMTGDDGDYGPLLALHDKQSRKEISKLDDKLQTSSVELKKLREEAFENYLQNISHVEKETSGTKSTAATSIYPLDQVLEREKDGHSVLTLDGNEDCTTALAPTVVDGISGKAVHLDGGYGYLQIKGQGLIEVADQFSAALWICPDQDLRTPDARQCRVLLGTAGDKNRFWRGWEFFLDEQGHLAVWLVHSRPDNLLHVRSQEPIEDGKWTHVVFAYDGTGRAAGVRLFVDGQQVDSEIRFDQLDRSIFPRLAAPGYPIDKDRTIRVGRSYRGFTGDFGIYQGSLDDIRLFEASLTNLEVATLYGEFEVARQKPNNLSESDRFDHWLRRSNRAWQKADERHRALLAERVKILSEVPQIMVMEEMSKGRPTYVLERGDYTHRREQVKPATPQAVMPWSNELPPNRLGLARWLFDPANPLTASVAVNRYWQLMFGQGLVPTTHDFGIQGQRPSHPELLDWLAVEFRDSGWDVRALLRLIANSATYRQSSSISAWREHANSHATAELADPQLIDPGNTLLWRGASYRLPGEMLRDGALESCGLLVHKVGGPSVKPYQPPGLWEEKNNFSQELLEYKPDSGDGLYRRSLYTFIRRTSPPPSMTAFDAPERSVCTVKRETTNTPLQSLVLLNDPQFVEAARVLSQSVLREVKSEQENQIKEVFSRLLGREPTSDELNDLCNLFEEALDRYRLDPEAANALLSIGESPLLEELDRAETAALAIVANTLISFDEFYMKR